MKIRKTLGIDLGTTNSVVAMLDPTDSTIITAQDEEGQRTFPSVVAHHPQQNRLLEGRQARKLAGQSQPPVFSVKRYMGVEHRFTLGEQKMTPVDVSARILRYGCELMARTLQDHRQLLDHAVITMPAYFNHTQIEDTRRAGELAGLKVVELLHEPTAAAIYYAWVCDHRDATYLVYDLGGGTFDVSIIRARFGDYEVLGVSGDPFLGGDDFDRLLASHLQEKLVVASTKEIPFDLSTKEGAASFATLIRLAEQAKMNLSQFEEAECRSDDQSNLKILNRWGEPVAFHLKVDRKSFHRMIKSKVDRTIDCCHEALARAKEKCGLQLSEIDYVILVGGSTRVPLVAETIRAAFCNASLPAHVRHPEPLLQDPDLCVAYGAALRAATHGTRYLFSIARTEQSLLGDLDIDPGGELEDELQLHITSTMSTRSTSWTLTGSVQGPGSMEVTHGGSLQVNLFQRGITEEVFFDEQGRFTVDLELEPETDNAMELIVLDNLGKELTRIPACARHRSQGPGSPGLGVLPTQLITKPLSIEVLDRGKKRKKQILAPVGAALPGTFHCTCHTADQAGRIVVPILEENRVIKQMVIDNLDPNLPKGTPVHVDLQIDVKHNIEVSVRVQEAHRHERALLAAPPSSLCPTPLEVEAVQEEIEERLQYYSGSYRTRMNAKLAQLVKDLNEALFYEDEPRAIQRMSELRGLQQQLEDDKDKQQLDPPWHQIAQIIQDSLDLAEAIAARSERNLQPLVDPIHGYRHYAELAYKEKDQALCTECWAGLQRYFSSLEDLLASIEPTEREEWIPAEEEAEIELERFARYLSAIWKQAQTVGRSDLEEEIQRVANRAQGLHEKAPDDPAMVIREARRLTNELAKIEKKVRERPKPSSSDDAGLLSVKDL